MSTSIDPPPARAPRDSAPPSIGTIVTQWRKTVTRLAPYGRPHARLFWAGASAAAFVIAFRLVLPWVFGGLLRTSFEGPVEASTVRAALGLGLAALGLAALLGLADHLERLYFARFASGLARDLRRAAVGHSLERAAGRADGVSPDPEVMERPPGEIAYGLIGDTARMKTATKGFLVHVATNLVLCVGVVIVMLANDLALGSIFAVLCLLTAGVTFYGALHVYVDSKLARKRESKLADATHAAFRTGVSGPRTDKLLGKPTSPRTVITRTQGRTTWAAHALFGAALLAATLYAAQQLEAGGLRQGGLLTFLLYALMVRAPLVQLARQGARSGKILASAHRVGRLLRDAPGAPGAAALEPIESEPSVSRPVADGLELRADGSERVTLRDGGIVCRQ